ncbi:amino acid adenylation domain-containing protein [Micromonospora peucetia]|uniref:Amino acid adenylation domain-containing protein n=1 Tax=Micromonospora peucetia TaxID=47871 RepID=A0ABZ1EE72_9ACTN|nr:amino acid adenylation domain-containing protein [Micromonospora peucetia]WSA33144.1 amino acid adenylation domain-containing protein [Micromonospora peucetia]
MPPINHPMSFEQESIWLNDQFREGRSLYLESWAYRLRGRLDIAALEAAVSEIVRRHEGLRSRLHLVGDRPVQTVSPARPVRLIRRPVPVTRLPEAVREALSEPLSLDLPPLLRAHLFELGENDAVFMVTIHHAALDGTSIRVFDRECGALYRDAVEGVAFTLPGLSQQIGGYSARQRRAERLVGPANLAYWKAAMEGAPRESVLPVDRPRPHMPSHQGAEIRFRVPDDVARGVRRLAQEQRTTPYLVMLTALTVLLHRLSGQHDLVLGTPVSMRDAPALDSLIACLAEVLPLRLRVTPATTFATMLSSSQEVVLDAVDHREIRFGQLISQLGVERALGRFPLFQVVFTAEHTEPAGLSLPGIVAEPFPVHSGTAKYDIFMNVVPDGEGFRGSLEYATDLFDRESAERLVERYHTVIADAVSHPGRLVGDLAVLPQPEREFIRRTWTHRGLPEATQPLLHEAFTASARQHPDLPAVVLGTASRSYAEIEAASDALAALLVRSGHAGRAVAICLQRSFDLPVAVLAVLKAAGVCVPIDPAYPGERKAFMLRDSGATVVLTDHARAGRIPLPDGVAEILVDDVPLPRPTAGEVGSPYPVCAESLAYVLYTSGSTGRPKGVAMPHGSLANLVDWQRRRSGCGPGARTLQFAPLSFDVAFQELFSTWASAGTVVLVEEEARTNPEHLYDALIEQGVERIFLPFVALQQLAAYGSTARRACPSLKEVITAGEQLFITPAIREFFTDLTDAYLENQYGPSETHVVTAERLIGHPASWPRRPPIGRPIDGVRTYVMDDRLRPVPIGSTGELCIGGRAPARGYLGRPDLTAEKFRVDPHASGSGRLYRSGDLARLLPDGRIEFIGRADDQVKIRGHRVETGEVESAVRAVAGVVDAIVAAAADEPGDGGRLIAGYLTTATGGVTPDNLRATLRDRLPTYMVPAVCVPLTSFPLTPSGKVDRAAFVGTALAATSSGAGSEGPRTTTEKRIIVEYARVLDLVEVGVEDDFFQLGGDSLRAVKLALALRAELGVNLPMNAVFTAPSVAALAVLADSLDEQQEDIVPTADIALPTEIAPTPPVVPVASDPREILLTGATGFLGAFLLRELIRSTTARVHCLVRGDDMAGAARRLRAVLEGYGLWEPAMGDRIEVLHGDLARPGLGLSPEILDGLARTVDVIYHSGAAVNLAQSYAQSRAANVMGTTEILRLAAARRTVPVHHISTTGVFAGPLVTGRRITADEPLTPLDGLIHGYTRSKWVAEKVIDAARGRGLPVSVYRPTRISGHSRTGACQSADYLWLLLKGCIQARLAPRLRDVAFDLVPVDYVSQAIVALSTSTAAAGRNVTLASDQLLPFGTALEHLRAMGYPIATGSDQEWMKAIATMADNAAFPLLGVMSGDGQDSDQEGSTRFDATETGRLLGSTGIACPEIDEGLFGTYVRYFLDSGFLPHPQRETTKR